MSVLIFKGNIEILRVLHFLERIGIEVIEKKLNSTTFLPGLSLVANCIYVDFNKLKYPGDLLHETGHLAVTDGETRKNINTSVTNTD